MVNRFAKNQERASGNFGGEFSGGNPENANKSENETEVSFKKVNFKKFYLSFTLQVYVVYVYKIIYKHKFNVFTTFKVLF